LLIEKYGSKLDEKGKAYCDQIQKAAEQIEKFTTDINEYIKSKKVSLRIEKTDIKKILTHIRREVSPLLKARKIKWSEPDAIPDIMADHMAMTRVLRNLIDNALKHSGKNLTKIDIAYDQDKYSHIFSFSNDGVAMKRKDSEVIFDMFQRLPESQQVEGSGLGLTIVKEIVEAHKGKVWFESGPKKGTTFYVSIPKDLKK
jgi:light-regulated signal transduction histidine kinase (bacteriophytochrome)